MLVAACHAGSPVTTGAPATRASAVVAAPSSSANAPAPATSGAAPLAAMTPGKIACGATDCDLGLEVCCGDGVHRPTACVPRLSNRELVCDALPGSLEENRCDEAADCPAGQGCCTTWACSGECPPVTECAAVPCLHGPVERCVAGGACRPGFSCVVTPGARVGTCVFEAARVACGRESCSGDGSVCCWDTETRTGSCQKSCGDEPREGLWSLTCLGPDDCGGYPCANRAESPFAFSTCMLGDYNVPDASSVIFCRSVADCPEHNFFGSPKACERDERFPASAKTCVYPEPEPEGDL